MLAFHMHLSATSAVSNLLPISLPPQLVKYLSGHPGLVGRGNRSPLLSIFSWVVPVVMRVVVVVVGEGDPGHAGLKDNWLEQ